MTETIAIQAAARSAPVTFVACALVAVAAACGLSLIHI